MKKRKLKAIWTEDTSPNISDMSDDVIRDILTWMIMVYQKSETKNYLTIDMSDNELNDAFIKAKKGLAGETGE